MTRKTAFLTVVATALVLAAPAWGGVDQSQGSNVAQTDSHERASAVQLNGFVAQTDSHERALVVSSGGFVSGADQVRIDSSSTPLLDANDRVRIDSRSSLLDSNDRVRIDPAELPVPVPATSSGRELEWPQLGLGLGLGIALALGLFLTVRYTRARPLAH